MKTTLSLISLTLLMGCGENNNSRIQSAGFVTNKEQIGGTNFRIIDYEGCEYVVLSRFNDGSGETSLTHKGNCTYCIKRK